MRITPSPRLVRALVRGLTRTLRFHLFGTEHLRAAARLSPTGTFVACFWHQSLVAMVGPHEQLPVAALVSKSRDGEITARYLESMGLRPVRGSSSKGGSSGARELMRALHDGWFAVLILDGPRGPYKEVKSGAIEIARRCGVPLIPMAARATRELSLKRSWDRFRVPLPLSHVAVVYGEAITYPAGEPDDATLLERRRGLARAMHDLEARASRLVGRRDLYPLAPDLAWMRPAGEHAARTP
jgi:lysophospholipid acyltransferase (LPLAT)-like uncharacterized protein